MNVTFAGIQKLSTSGYHIAVVEYRIYQHQLKPILSAFKSDTEVRSLLLAPMRRWKSVKRAYALINNRKLVYEIASRSAIGMNHLKHRLPYITLSVSRHLKGDIFKAKESILTVIDTGIAGREFPAHLQSPKSPGITDCKPPSVVEMTQNPRFVDLHAIRRMRRIQYKIIINFSNHIFLRLLWQTRPLLTFLQLLSY